MKKAKNIGLLILVLAIVIFLSLTPFLFEGKYLAWIGFAKQKDGITQHATILQSYFNEGGYFPLFNRFDFSIGLGADYFISDIYYMILDPFNLFVYLFPFSNFLVTYSLIIILKFLASGIFMYLYLKHKKINNKNAIIMSTCYMISGFLLFTFPRHPDISAGAIYLPLIIYGVEKIFAHERPYLLIISAFLCYISSFYMFFMVSVFVVLYTILYYFEHVKNKNFQTFVIEVGKVAMWYLVAILLATFMTLPVLFGYLNSARGASKGLKWFDFNYYSSLILQLIVPIVVANYTPLLTNLLVVFLTIPIYFFKGNKTYKISLSVLSIGLLVPLFGYVMNLLNYSNNRWLFLLQFVICVSIAILFEDNKNRQLVMKKENKVKKLWTQILFFKKMPEILLMVNVIFAFIFNVFYQKEFDDGTVWNQQESIQEHYVASKQKEEDFFRVDQMQEPLLMDNYHNRPIKNQYYGTYMYNTITNDSIYQFLTSQGLYNATHTLGITGLNQRKALQSLLSVKYFIDTDYQNEFRPYGYTSTDCTGVYQNLHYLPMGIFYEQKMSETEYYALPIYKRQEAMMNYHIVKDKIKTTEFNGTSLVKPFTASINLVENNLVVKENKTQVKFIIKDLLNEELYLNFTANAAKKIQTITITSPITTYEQVIYPKGHQMYSGNHQYSFCLGTFNQKQVEITIDFAKTGTLYDLNFTTYSMDSFERDYLQRKNQVMEEIEFNQSLIKGKINTAVNGSLFFSIPYNKGWQIKVDGHKKDLYRSNIGFMGVDLLKGEHTIELYYKTPHFKVGLIISSITFVFLVGYVTYDIIIYSKKKRLLKNKKNNIIN